MNTQKTFIRLITLQRRYHFYFIGIMKPFQDSHNIEDYRARLGMQHAVENSSRKIWAFCDAIVDYIVIRDEVQEMTLKLHNQEAGMSVVVTLVYAKCNQQERLILWKSLTDIAQSMHDLWIIGGDFNVITCDEEKLRGLPIIIVETDNFNHCISLCNL